MKTTIGNLWSFSGVICVPTNLGWKRDGTNVMGRGLACEAAVRYPMLPIEYGAFCRDCGTGIDRGPVSPHLFPFSTPARRLICVAVKPLNKDSPWASWRSLASLDLVTTSIRKLANYAKGISGVILVVPFGCGNGGLDQSTVIPIMKEHLGPVRDESGEDKFVLVLRDGELA